MEKNKKEEKVIRLEPRLQFILHNALLTMSYFILFLVTIDCLPTSGHIQVDLMGASTTGTIVLYNNVPAYCTNFPTPTSVISVTFTTCDNPADFPAFVSQSIYVEGNNPFQFVSYLMWK